MRGAALAILASLLGALLPGAARAQSTCQYIQFGAVLTPAEWSQCFENKQDFLGYTPLNPANVVAAEPITASTVGTTITLGFDYTHAGTFTAVQQVDLNVSILQAAQAGTVFRIANVDGTNTRYEADAYAATAHFTGLRADGTAASPTTLQSGDLIASFNAFGYDGSAFVGPQAAFRCYAGQNWTTSALGTYCDVATTANGATSEAEVVRFFGSGGVSIGNTTDPGAGNLSVNGSIVQPTFAFGTGALSNITASSTNPGYANELVSQNLGTLSNSGTIANFVANLNGTNAYVTLEAIGGSSPSAYLVAQAGLTGGLTINSAAAAPLVLEGAGDASYPVQLNFGTGGYSQIQALSANTANENQLLISNSGTSSNAGTSAAVTVNLSCSSCYASMAVAGGSSPVATISSNSGLTGGMNIETVAGNLGVVSATNEFFISGGGTNTGNAVQAFVDNAGTLATSGTEAVIVAEITGTGASNNFLGLYEIGGASPLAEIASGAGNSAGMLVTSGAGSLALSSASNVVNFNGSGTNTGATVQAEVNNSGTVSNSATIAQFVANLSAGSNTYFVLQAIGGSSPTATVGAGSGLTGGMSITTAAGGISLEPTTSVSVVSAPFGLSGNQSATAWTTSGIRYKNVAATLTDTSSSGTVATAYTSVFGGDTIAASNSGVTYTNYFAAYFKAPVAGTNVTLTNAWALGVDSLNNGGAEYIGTASTDYAEITGGSSGATVNTNGGSLTIESNGNKGLSLASTGAMTAYNQPTTGSISYAVCAATGANGTGGGAIILDTSATICGLSAARFKNLMPEDAISPRAALAAVVALRTEPWRYRSEYQDGGDRVHVSLIADDVAAMNPDCAEYDPDGRVRNYDDRCVEAYLVAAVKELREERAR